MEDLTCSPYCQNAIHHSEVLGWNRYGYETWECEILHKNVCLGCKCQIKNSEIKDPTSQDNMILTI